MKLSLYWLCRWLAFFKANDDYSAYCVAKVKGDDAALRRLEIEFGRIAELYADWGDIRNIPTLDTSAGFVAWREPRHALFLDDTRVQWIEDPASYVLRPGHMLLDIPMADRKSVALKEVEKFLDLYYRFRKTRASTKAGMRIVQQPLSEPKYVLYAPTGNVNKATVGSLRKAWYVGRLRKRNRVAGNAMSLTDTVLAVKQDPRNPFGWTLTDVDKRDIEKGVYKKGLFGSSEVTLVKRAQKDFDAYVRNTIHGRFPDNS